MQYQLDDPKEYEDETIVVVGAGDAAIENALALSEQNRVILVNRNEEFTRCKEGNLTLVLSAIKEGRVEIRYGTSAAKVERVGGDAPLALQREEPRRPRRHRVPPHHRAPGRHSAAQARGGLRREVPVGGPERGAGAHGHATSRT